MKIYRENEIPNDKVVLTCRESSLKRFISIITILIIIAIIRYLLIKFDGYGVFLLFPLPLLALFIGFAIKETLPCFKKSHFQLKVYNEGILVNLRSFYNINFKADNPHIIFIPRNEIVCINESRIESIPPNVIDDAREEDRKLSTIDIFDCYYLDITINSEDIDLIKIAIIEEINLPLKDKFGNKKKNHYPVTIEDDNFLRIRIEWKSNYISLNTFLFMREENYSLVNGTSYIKPNLDKTIKVLSKYYTIGDPHHEKMTKEDIAALN